MNKLKTSTFYNEGFGTITVSLEELPLYGEGRNIDEAIDDLIDSIIELSELYLEKIEVYKNHFSSHQTSLMQIIFDCYYDRNKIKRILSIV